MSRARPPFVEALLQELVFLVPVAFVWLICAAVVEHFGGGLVSAAIVSGIIALVVFNPWFFSLSAFRCKSCGGVFTHSEVICRGWGIVT